MADYDFSKPAPDRSHRVPIDSGSGTGGLGLIIAGAVILLVVLYGVFAGGSVPVTQDPSAIAPASEVPANTVPADQAPAADTAPAATE